jgi:hypothetical protein
MVPAEEGGDPDSNGRVGAIPDDIAWELDWTPIEAKAGEQLEFWCPLASLSHLWGSLLLFDHMLPHQSSFNRSDGLRRTVYILFNKKSEGEFHKQYYQKMAEMRKAYQDKLDLQRDFAALQTLK